MDQVYRAFIPKQSADWFNRFLNQNAHVDVWLSMRKLPSDDIRLNNNNNNNNSASQNDAAKGEVTSDDLLLKNFKYYAEFRVSGDDSGNFRNIIEKKFIKLDLLIDDVQTYLNRTMAASSSSLKSIYNDYDVDIDDSADVEGGENKKKKFKTRIISKRSSNQKEMRQLNARVVGRYASHMDVNK